MVQISRNTCPLFAFLVPLLNACAKQAAQDAAVSSGGRDGHLLKFDGDTGTVSCRFDPAQEFTTANGIAGKAGAIDAHSLAAGSSIVFVESGYGRFGQTPGNVLLAFKAGSN